MTHASTSGASCRVCILSILEKIDLVMTHHVVYTKSWKVWTILAQVFDDDEQFPVSVSRTSAINWRHAAMFQYLNVLSV